MITLLQETMDAPMALPMMNALGMATRYFNDLPVEYKRKLVQAIKDTHLPLLLDKSSELVSYLFVTDVACTLNVAQVWCLLSIAIWASRVLATAPSSKATSQGCWFKLFLSASCWPFQAGCFCTTNSKACTAH